MKKKFMLSILILFLITLIGSVSATLCQNSNGYYEDCSKFLGYYDNYGDYNYPSNYYASNYAYGKMDSCRDSYGNIYPCYKQYRNNLNYYYDTKGDYRYYGDYYRINNPRLSINYRDVYGNYVTEIKPDYTKKYIYNNYDFAYNNPYYPDFYINYKNQIDNRDVVVYIR